eukprot:CAMPEP_0117428664 /NCGR_PEP_ID=MMETSP0758-20121206/8315_1 /TAXON_ID=63605 /ORGANISM="Percolomonas cosmopolitus, Strain AE-1 (ATCC 50343)" /LENGTH=626 /DNA_ID=CAMNT_0005215133 /DNA_START=471 /DNA_END=2348 /DNA_ORIENTATION=+
MSNRMGTSSSLSSSTHSMGTSTQRSFGISSIESSPGSVSPLTKMSIEEQYLEAQSHALGILQADEQEKYKTFEPPTMDKISFPPHLKRYVEHQEDLNVTDDIYISEDDDGNSFDEEAAGQRYYRQWIQADIDCFVHCSWAESCLRFARDCQRYAQKLILEQQRQLDAIHAAHNSLQIYADSFNSKSKTFTDYFNRYQPEFNVILDHFDEDLQKLNDIKIDANLRLHMKDNPETLYDCIPVEGLQKWKLKCQSELKAFQKKLERSDHFTSQLADELSKLKNPKRHEAFTLQKQKLFDDLKGFLVPIQKCYKLLENEYKGIFIPKQKDPENIPRLSKETLEKKEKELVELINSRQQKYDQLLGNLNELMQLKKKLYKAKQLLTIHFHKQLYHVSEFQYRIKKMQSRQSTYISVLMSLYDNFTQLAVVRRFPSLYHISLLEIHRRSHFLKAYQHSLQQMQKRMTSLREAELTRQHRYVKHISRLLPNTFLPELGQVDVPEEFVDSSPKSPTLLPKVSLHLQDSSQVDHLQKLFRKSGFQEGDFTSYYASILPFSNIDNASSTDDGHEGMLLNAPSRTEDDLLASMLDDLSNSDLQENSLSQKVDKVNSFIDKHLGSSNSQLEEALQRIK